MALRIQGHRIKSEIPYILHPTTKSKLTNPQHIAYAFSEYYNTLYNI